MSLPHLINQSLTLVPLTGASSLLSCAQPLVIASSTRARRPSLRHPPLGQSISQDMLVLIMPLPDSAKRELLLDLAVLAADRHPVLGVVTPLRPQFQPRVVFALTLDRSLAESVDFFFVPDEELSAPPRYVDHSSDVSAVPWNKWKLALVKQKEYVSREAKVVAEEGLLKRMQGDSGERHRLCIERVTVPDVIGNHCRVR